MAGPANDMLVDDLRQRIRDGATVHMGFASGERVWWLEDPYVEIDDATMREAAVGHNGEPLLEESGDSLFGWRANSQTWRSIFA